MRPRTSPAGRRDKRDEGTARTLRRPRVCPSRPGSRTRPRRLDARCRRERARCSRWSASGSSRAAVASGRRPCKRSSRPIDGPLAPPPPPRPALAERGRPGSQLDRPRACSSPPRAVNRPLGRFLDEDEPRPSHRHDRRLHRYYVLEKECSLGSARLASRYSCRGPGCHARDAARATHCRPPSLKKASS